MTEIRSGGGSLEDETRQRAEAMLEEALLAFAEGVMLFDREHKLEALNRARSSLARCAALFLIAAGVPPEEPVFSWIVAIESEVVPALGGFARWAASRKGRP